MEKDKLNKIVSDLKEGRYKSISKNKISEADLLEIANKLKASNYDVTKLLYIILFNRINENCDWNIGSLLQHFDYNEIINALQNVPTSSRAYLYDSIGLLPFPLSSNVGIAFHPSTGLKFLDHEQPPHAFLQNPHGCAFTGTP